MRHLLAVAEVSKNVERHRRDPRFLHRVDQRLRQCGRHLPASRSREPIPLALVEDSQRQLLGDLPHLQPPPLRRRAPASRPHVADRLLEERSIAEEHLVRPLARQHHRDFPARKFRQQEFSDRRECHERQLGEPQAAFQILPKRLFRDLQLVMLGPDYIGRARRIFLLVPAAPDESDREAVQLRVEVSLHQRTDERRVDPAAKIQAYRHIRPQAQPHGFLQLLQDGPRCFSRRVAVRLRDRRGALRRNFVRPIALCPRLQRVEVHRDVGRRRHMPDVLERETRVGGILLEERVERLHIELSLDQSAGEDRLDLRREHEPVGHARHVQRLDPEPVAPGDQQALRLVVEQEGELSAQMLEAVEPMFLVQIDDDLGIALGLEAVALRLERAPDPLEIVNFAIRRKDDAAVLADHRLLAGDEVDDGEPRMRDRQPRVFVDEQPAPIRPAVAQRFEHVLKRAFRNPGSDRRENPAHGSADSRNRRSRHCERSEAIQRRSAGLPRRRCRLARTANAETAPRLRYTVTPMSLLRLRQSAERLIYRVAGLPVAMGAALGGSDDPLHAAFARRYWRPESATEWAELAAAMILWPFGLLAASAWFTAHNGTVIRGRTGKRISAQLREQLALYFSDGILPPWYYMFSLHDDGARRAPTYIQRFETKTCYFRLLKRRKGSPLNDKRAFAEHCAKHGIRSVETLMTIDGAHPGEPLPDRDLFVKPQGGRGGRGAERWDRIEPGTFASPAGDQLTAEELL